MEVAETHLFEFQNCAKTEIVASVMFLPFIRGSCEVGWERLNILAGRWVGC